MKNIRTFHSVALGESHKAKNTPCQDAALSYEDHEIGIYIALVSDGHGNERHFMSDHGSKILVQVALDSIKSFIETSESNLLSVPFATSAVISSNDDKSSAEEQISNKKPDNQAKLMKGLISSIMAKWNLAIEKDWNENTPSLEYMRAKNVPEASIKDYSNGINIEVAYGCTLIAFIKTSDFWFALQIGDGTCIAFDVSGEPFLPIPDDERYSGSTTASMCNEDALESFRYCYGNTEAPVAVFLGSDGLDGVFGTMDEFSIPQLENFYKNIIKTFIKKGFERTVKEIEEALPQLSAKGVTRDDMSLAGVINLDEIPGLLPLLVKKDLENAKKELAIGEEALNVKKEDVLEKESAIKQKQDDVKSFINTIKEQEEIIASSQSKLVKANEDLKKKEIEVQKEEEELNHVKSGLEKAVKEKEILQKKMTDLTKEFNEINKEELSDMDHVVKIEDRTEKTFIESEVRDSSEAKKSMMQKLGSSLKGLIK